MSTGRPKFAKRRPGGRGGEIASNESTAGSSSKPSLSSAPISYTVCTTAVEAAQAFTVLAAAPYILVDCEGCDMNALSLMQIGTPHAEHVFLFDFIALSSPESRACIMVLLSNPNIVKVFWDGRSDYSDLLSTCGVQTSPVLDLQLVDIHSRAIRNLDRHAHIVRLSRKTSPIQLIKKLQLNDVHVLNGMDNAIREHKVQVALKDPVVNKMHAEGRAGEWLKRPLTKTLLDYAAADIVRIAALYDHFERRQYLTAGMVAAFQVYSSLFYSSSTPLTLEENIEGNVYKRSGILPLNIVPPGFGYGPAARYRAPPPSARRGNFVCDMCGRGLPRYCFPFVLSPAERDMHVKRGSYVGPCTEFPRSASCKACTVHLERERFEAEEKVKKEKEREEKAKVAEAQGAGTVPDHPPISQRAPAKQKQATSG